MSREDVTPNRQAASPLRVAVRIREVADGNAEGKQSWLRKHDSTAWRAGVLFAVLIIAGTYVGSLIGQGWVPADEGTLAQSALRVMHGQLPHRDFGEIYTGGLSFIHAAAFRVFGVNLMSLRICVFLFFLGWLATVYYVALRFTSAIAAAAVTLLAAAWSYPNYPAAMPSWYNLFFATFGAAALLRYLEVRTRRWLFVAGVCGGISILIKVIGAYYIAGVLLFLAYVEQSESSDGERTSSWLYRLFSGSALLLFLATLINLLRTRLRVPELYHFVLPSAAIVLLIFVGEMQVRAGTGKRFRTIFGLVVPFLSGVLVPVTVFLAQYAHSGMIGQFLFGVTSSAASRVVDLSVLGPVGIKQMWYILPLIGILAAAMYWDKFQSKAVGAALCLGAIALAVRSSELPEIVSGIWFSVASLTPAAVLFGTAALVRARRTNSDPVKRQQVVLLISLAATCTLVQFPFAAPIYLTFALPLTLLAVVAIVSTCRVQRGTYALVSVMGLYLVIGAFSIVPRHIYELTYIVGHMDPMDSPRAGGLKVDGAAFFDELSSFLREHSPNGLMFAGNDCPELYFLSGLTNVAHDDTGEPRPIILKAIQADNLNLVVINEHPYFPGAKMSQEVTDEVERRFPNSKRFGIFHVYWKR